MIVVSFKSQLISNFGTFHQEKLKFNHALDISPIYLRLVDRIINSKLSSPILGVVGMLSTLRLFFLAGSLLFGIVALL